MRIVVRLLLYLMAAGCFEYSVIIARVNSGSKFYLVWDAIGIILILIAVGIRLKLHLSQPVKILIICLTFVGLIVFTVLLTMILSCYHEREVREADYLIVLGAQIREDGPSVVLQYRLDRAVKYLTEYPDAKCIVSGGQGANEPCSEAEGMKRFLIGMGISADRIITEDESTSTRENFKFSAGLIPNGATVAVLTNNFHMRRALLLANRMGIEEPVAIVAESSPLFAPNNILREVLGLVKDLIFRA